MSGQRRTARRTGGRPGPYTYRGRRMLRRPRYEQAHDVRRRRDARLAQLMARRMMNMIRFMQ